MKGGLGETGGGGGANERGSRCWMGASGSEGVDRAKVGVTVARLTVVVYPIDERQRDGGGGRVCRRWKEGCARALLVPGSTILSPNPSSPFDN